METINLDKDPYKSNMEGFKKDLDEYITLNYLTSNLEEFELGINKLKAKWISKLKDELKNGMGKC